MSLKITVTGAGILGGEYTFETTVSDYGLARAEFDMLRAALTRFGFWQQPFTPHTIVTEGEDR